MMTMTTSPEKKSKPASPDTPDSVGIVQPQSFTAFEPPHELVLKSGEKLGPITQVYETYGRLNKDKTNAVLVLHSLTMDHHAAGWHPGDKRPGWWDPMIGPGKALDTDRFFVICINCLGSCKGTTGPASVNPTTGRPYGLSFPVITIEDIIRAQKALIDHSGITKLLSAVGGSMGGMLALEFALEFPKRTQALAVFAAPARQGPWARAWQHLQREAARRGDLALGRALSMLSYRHPAGFEQRWADDPVQAERYLDHQGAKFTRRFSAASYELLTRAMDAHDVGRGRGGLEAALARLSAPAVFVGIDSDLLYPAAEVRRTAAAARSEYAEITSAHGHDGFLIESDQVSRILRAFGF